MVKEQVHASGRSGCYTAIVRVKTRKSSNAAIPLSVVLLRCHHARTKLSIYVYIYIYMCVCVCVTGSLHYHATMLFDVPRSMK